MFSVTAVIKIALPSVINGEIAADDTFSEKPNAVAISSGTDAAKLKIEETKPKGYIILKFFAFDTPLTVLPNTR